MKNVKECSWFVMNDRYYKQCLSGSQLDRDFLLVQYTVNMPWGARSGLKFHL